MGGWLYLIGGNRSTYVVLYDLALEEPSMRLPPGAVTKRICGPGSVPDDLKGGIGAALGIDLGFPLGEVTMRIYWSELKAGGLDKET